MLWSYTLLRSESVRVHSGVKLKWRILLSLNDVTLRSSCIYISINDALSLKRRSLAYVILFYLTIFLWIRRESKSEDIERKIWWKLPDYNENWWIHSLITLVLVSIKHLFVSYWYITRASSTAFPISISSILKETMFKRVN